MPVLPQGVNSLQWAAASGRRSLMIWKRILLSHQTSWDPWEGKDLDQGSAVTHAESENPPLLTSGVVRRREGIMGVSVRLTTPVWYILAQVCLCQAVAWLPQPDSLSLLHFLLWCFTKYVLHVCILHYKLLGIRDQIFLLLMIQGSEQELSNGLSERRKAWMKLTFEKSHIIIKGILPIFF